MKYKNVKSYDWVKEYFADMEVLLNALHLKYSYNANKQKYFIAESEVELPVGDVKVGYSFIRGKDRANVTNGRLDRLVLHQFTTTVNPQEELVKLMNIE